MRRPSSELPVEVDGGADQGDERRRPGDRSLGADERNRMKLADAPVPSDRKVLRAYSGFE
jgi:hypothetical protein